MDFRLHTGYPHPARPCGRLRGSDLAIGPALRDETSKGGGLLHHFHIQNTISREGTHVHLCEEAAPLWWISALDHHQTPQMFTKPIAREKSFTTAAQQPKNPQ